MKNKDTNTKTPQEQIDAAHQKRLMSYDFKSRVKKSIESLKTFNLVCRNNTLTNSDIRGVAKYFADKINLSSRSKEPSTSNKTNENVGPKKTLF